MSAGPIQILLNLIIFIALPAIILWALFFRNKKAAVEQRVISTQETQEIVRAYAQVLGEDGAAVMRDVLDLPFKKKVISDALVDAIGFEDSSEIKQQMLNGFIWLSNFQVLTPDEKDALSKCETMCISENLSNQVDELQELSSAFDIQSRVAKRAQAEAESRLEQLQNLGLS